MQTTLEGVLAGKYRAAGLISFQAMVLPATAIQVRSGGRTSYYALAVGPDSAYIAAPYHSQSLTSTLCRLDK